MQMEQHLTNYKNKKSLGLVSDQDVITIPVVVHVLHTGQPIGTGLNISMDQIQSQIDVLNEDFRRLNSDATNTPAVFQGVAADPKIEFVLACLDPNGSPTNGVVRVQTNVNTFFRIPNVNDPNITNEAATGIKFAPTGSPSWPSDRYLNIWVCNLGGGLLGYAQFPDMMITQPETDGVVVNTTSFGRNGNVIAPYDKGRIATHEVGHWLNLRHIWGDAFCGDDFVEDTPTQEWFNQGCPQHPQSSCGSQDMFMNYMDYTDNSCMNIFTSGQTDRMRALFTPDGIRSSFIECDFLTQICNSKVNISGPNNLCSSSTYSIQDPSTGSTVSWSVSPANLFSGATSGIGATINLSPASSSVSGSATLTFSVTTDCGIVDIEKSIWIGEAAVNWIEFSNSANEFEQWCSSHDGNYFNIYYQMSPDNARWEARLLRWPSLTVAYTSSKVYSGSGPHQLYYIPPFPTLDNGY
jgi:hypothetical protein